MRKIDWPNHLVGFFSALFGLLIAFELDEWKENRKDKQIAENAFVRLQQEIDFNRNMLHEMVNINLQMISALEDQVLQNVDNKLLFNGTIEQAKAVNSATPLSSIAYIRIPEDDRKQQGGVELHIIFSGLIQPGIHNSAWESAKTIGALNNMSYEKVLSLSSLYNPTRLMDELAEIRTLLRNADDVRNKTDLENLLGELKNSYHIIDQDLNQFDAFAAMLDQME
jgi:hypothetical protein